TFRSGDHLASGSLFGDAGTPGPGFVLCPGWGLESSLLLGWLVRLAADVAAAGGHALVVQWPGFEDGGVPDEPVTVDDLVQVVRDAAREGTARAGTPRWSPVGIRLGAAVAALAAEPLAAERLVLV